MADNRFLALLRGINVGGKNIIAKQDLQACFESLKLTSVKTYIQSGNVLFRSRATDVQRLTRRVEKGLADTFDYDAQAVVIPFASYVEMVESAPADWGKDDEYRHNAMFLLAGGDAKELLSTLPSPKPQIEMTSCGPGVIFWSVLKEQASKSTMVKLSANAGYQQMTVRNHNTTFKLLSLFDTI